MIKLCFSAAIVAAAFLSPIVTDCEGCAVVKTDTVNIPRLTVTFPATMKAGECVECSSCGTCIGHPCRFDGVLTFTNTNAPGPGGNFYYRKNGQDGETCLAPGKSHKTTYFDEDIDCGSVDVYGGWSFTSGGQQWPVAGWVEIGCSKCAEAQ